MLILSTRQRGFSLVELLIVMVIVGLVAAMGFPLYQDWMRNSQMRVAAETMQGALQMARMEAISRNTSVRFQLVSTLDDGCAVSTSGNNWVVSVSDPAGKCDVTDATLTPFIVRRGAAGEAGSAVTFALSNGTNDYLEFSAMGLLKPAQARTITIGNSGYECSSSVRCMRLEISGGGQVRLCDPSISSDQTSDPRRCL